MGSGYGDAFQDGQSYTLTVNTSAGTVTRTMQAPGQASLSPDGLTLSWSPESFGWDQVYADRTNPSPTNTFSSWSLGKQLTSPLALPGSAYPTAGNYQVRASITNEGGITGTHAASLFRITRYSITPIVK
jgi:hypothetical protein